MRCARTDFLITARASVVLRRARPGNTPNVPVAITVLLDLLMRAAQRSVFTGWDATIPTSHDRSGVVRAETATGLTSEIPRSDKVLEKGCWREAGLTKLEVERALDCLRYI